MPSASSRPAAHSWQRLRKIWRNDLTDLKVREISLVDSPASRGAVIALAKRDTGQETIYQRTLQPGGRYSLYRPVRKQSRKPAGGPGELALPQYPANQDPQFNDLIRPSKGANMPITSNVITDKKKRKKKFSDLMARVGKSGCTMTRAQQEALVKKRAERIAARTGGNVQKIEGDIWIDLSKKDQIAREDLQAPHPRRRDGHCQGAGPRPAPDQGRAEDLRHRRTDRQERRRQRRAGGQPGLGPQPGPAHPPPERVQHRRVSGPRPQGRDGRLHRAQ
jgi:hypothetical protein